MSKKDQFTPANAPCTHVTIEAVFAVAEGREMEDVLDQLRQYGSAVVVERQQIAESIEEAHQILQRRALK